MPDKINHKKKIKWHIGCSGFHYKEWKEIFYPKGLATGKWFKYYTEHFDTMESNVTFYRLPTQSMLKRWHDESNEHFLFSVKGPRLVTHYKRFIDVDSAIKKFYDTIFEGLQEKIACVLFQLPPKWNYTPERLESIITALDPAFNNVLEFRDSSWWNQEVYDRLTEHSITFCGISHPTLPDTVVRTSSIYYFRFHGTPKMFYSSYDHKYLDGIIKKIKRLKHIEQAYIYFNNTAGPAAIENADYLKQQLNQ